MNIVQFRWSNKFICQDIIDWKFSKGDVFTYWLGTNKVVNVIVNLTKHYDGVHVCQTVFIEPIDWNPTELGWDKLEEI